MKNPIDLLGPALNDPADENTVPKREPRMHPVVGAALMAIVVATTAALVVDGCEDNVPLSEQALTK